MNLCLLRIFLVVQITLLVSVIAWYVGILLPTDPVDGAYQTFHFLNRMKLGAFGDGYLPYLGYGVSITLFPLFLAFGGDVAASNIAAHWAVIAAAALTLWICLSIFRVEKTYALIVIFCVTVVLFLQDSVLFIPGNSLRLWRGALPILMALLIYPMMARPSARVSDLQLTVLIGVMAGLGLYWSNDFGIPTAISLVMIWTIWLIRGRSGNPAQIAFLCLLCLVVSVSTFGLVGIVFLGEHFVPYLVDNYRDSAEQQFWYFYPYDENSRIYSLGDFISAIYSDVDGEIVVRRLVCIAIALGAMLKILVSPGSVETDRRLALAAFLVLATSGGGLLAELGGHRASGYWIGLDRLVFFGTLAALFAIPYHVFLAWFSRNTAVTSYNPHTHIGSDGAGIVAKTARWARFRPLQMGLLIVSCGVSLSIVVGVAIAGGAIHEKRGSVYWPDLGGFIDSDHVDLLDISEALQSRYPMPNGDGASRYFSLYYGPVEAAMGGANPAPTDSIIHAHGRRRSLFYEVFASREWPIVATINPKNSSWAAWNRASAWPFFRQLFLRYELRYVSKFNLFWFPLEQPKAPMGGAVSCEIEAGALGNALTLWLGSENEPPAIGMLYEVELDIVAGQKENVSIFDNILRRGLIRVEYLRADSPSYDFGTVNEHGLPLMNMPLTLVVEAAVEGPNPIRIASHPSAHTFVGATNCTARSFLMSPWHAVEVLMSADGN